MPSRAGVWSMSMAKGNVQSETERKKTRHATCGEKREGEARGKQ